MVNLFYDQPFKFVNFYSLRLNFLTVWRLKVNPIETLWKTATITWSEVFNLHDWLFSEASKNSAPSNRLETSILILDTPEFFFLFDVFLFFFFYFFSLMEVNLSWNREHLLVPMKIFSEGDWFLLSWRGLDLFTFQYGINLPRGSLLILTV